MKKKYAIYVLTPLLTAVLVYAGSVSAHGWFSPAISAEQKVSMLTQEFQRTAKLFDISIEEAKEYWVQGKTIWDIATEKGVTEDVLRTRLNTERQEQIKSELSALVTAGVITQDQADRRLQASQNIESSKKGRVHGGHPRFGM